MYPDKDTSFIHRFIQSLLPSPISAILCVIGAGAVVLLYAVILSTSIGTSMPALFYGEWSIVYTNHIVQPLLTLFNDMTVTTIGTLLAWGLLGLIVYFAIEYVVHIYQGWNRAEHDIGMSGMRIVQHPARKLFIVTTLWRLGVLVVFSCIFLFGLQVPLYRLALLAPGLVLGERNLSGTLMLLVAELALFAHLFVVFLRLYMMRVRLFGEV
jgi:hypothetical protein